MGRRWGKAAVILLPHAFFFVEDELFFSLQVLPIVRLVRTDDDVISDMIFQIANDSGKHHGRILLFFFGGGHI